MTKESVTTNSKGLRNELNLQDPDKIDLPSEQNKEIETLASDFALKLLEFTETDTSAQDESKGAIESMGIQLQRQSSHQSNMLKQPVKALSKAGDDGGPVANALVDLKIKVEELDPNKFDFSSGWVSRVVSIIPGVGSKLTRYFSQFESAQTVIDSIIRSLVKGRDQLSRDNVTMTEDQKQMRALTKRFEKQISLGQLIDQKLLYKADRDFANNEFKKKFIEEELIFPLRQRLIDLQQQMAVNQQGIIALEIIIRNNKELIRGVNRAVDVTVSALQVAVTVAIALANQKIVLDKISMLSKTTSDLIAGTASKLKTQGIEIQKQASSATLDLDSLKSAFADVNSALDDISSFRRESLPQMAETIVEFDHLIGEGEKSISRLEDGSNQKTRIELSF